MAESNPSITAATVRLTLAGAQAALAGALAEAERAQWAVSIAVTDPAGHLLAFLRMDAAPTASADIAPGKARAAARFGRPSKVLADRVKDGVGGLIGVPGVLAMEGGEPIVIDGVLVGGIGVSGVTSAQDAQVAAAGVRAIGGVVAGA